MDTSCVHQVHDTIETLGSWHCFIHDELKVVTNGFSHENHLGQGGFVSICKWTASCYETTYDR